MAAQPISNSASSVPASKAGTTLAVSLFGGCGLNLDGREVVVANKKAKALIGYLAFAPNQSESRERLVGLLWSENDEDKARASLRQTVKSLRDTLEEAGFQGFQTFRSDLGFEPGSLKIDALRALDSVMKGWPDDVLLDRHRVADDLLAGYDDVDPAFRTWVLVQRESLRQKLIRELQERLNAAEATSPGAKRIAEALLQLDPTHEPACQCVMRAHVDAGDTAAALATYNKLWALLDSEHDMEPSESTQTLVAAIKGGSYQPAVPAGTARITPLLGPATAVAPAKLVLIIGDFAHSGENKQLAMAFRHELITRLTRFREWSIVDGEPKDGALAQSPAAYILSAPVLEGPRDMNLMLSLRDSRTGVVVWSERYPIALENFFDALQDVMRQIAAKLSVYISVERLNRIAAKPDVSLDIYDRWLRGQHLIQQWQAGNRERAREIFNSITRDTPHFSPAHSSLAQMDNADHIVLPGTYRTIESHTRALACANKAVETDPLDSRAQLALAWASAMNGDHDLAETHFDQACHLNEDDSWTMTSSSLGYAFGGKLEKANDTLANALRLRPLPTPLHWCYHSNVQFLSGRYDESIVSAEHVGELVSNMPAWRAAALAHLGRIEEAREAASRFVTIIRAGWQGASEPTPLAVARWLLHCFPTRNAQVLAGLRTGLKVAGLPVLGQ